MTAFALTSTLPAAPRVGFGRMAQFAREWKLRRKTPNEVARFDERMRRDVGVLPRHVDPGVELLKKARIS